MTFLECIFNVTETRCVIGGVGGMRPLEIIKNETYLMQYKAICDSIYECFFHFKEINSFRVVNKVFQLSAIRADTTKTY